MTPYPVPNRCKTLNNKPGKQMMNNAQGLLSKNPNMLTERTDMSTTTLKSG